jgi:hypothetical protein
MTKRTESLLNFSNEGHDLLPVLVNSSTAVTLLPAWNPVIEGQIPLRIDIYNPNNSLLWVKNQPAEEDNLKRSGIIVHAGLSRTIYTATEGIYLGEISGILDKGSTGLVYVSWI